MKRNPARMKYQKDTLSSMLCILSIAFNVYYFISVFRSDYVVPDAFMGVDVLVNIVFMMLVFLVSEKLKAYAKGWSNIALVLGILEIARIFILPAHYKALDMMTGWLYWGAVISLGLAGFLLIIAFMNAAANSRLLASKAQSTGGN